jgi:hypothetical protein
MKDFLLKVVTSGSGVSSKRVLGALCYLIITISLIVLAFINPEFSGLSDMISTLIITTASLLGMTTIEKFTSYKKKDDVINQDKEN